MEPLEKSEIWTRESGALIDGASFETTRRLRVSISLLLLSIEHQMGIHTLIKNELIASAFSLVRLQLETYVRGVWFLHCATEEQLGSFLKGKEPPKIQPLIDAVQKIEGFKDGSLGRFKTQIWPILNDFTHGGTIQVKARNTKDEIISNFEYDHIVEILGTSVTLGLLAGVAMAGAMNNPELANNLNSLHNKLYAQAT